MIKVEHLYKGFGGISVLKDISLEYEAGKCNMIVGAVIVIAGLIIVVMSDE